MKKNILRQVVRFGLVGVLNTLVSQIVYTIGIAIGLHYLLASVLAFLISVFHAYLWQTNFVFKEEKEEKEIWWKTLIKTYATYAFTGLILNNILLFFWMDIINIERFTPWITNVVNDFGIHIDNHKIAALIAPLSNCLITIPLNFILNKYWTYKSKRTKQ